MATELARVPSAALRTSEDSSLDALRETQAYQSLLSDCREICNGARLAVLEHMWRLGERIAADLPPDREEGYGRQIILGLERDLATDRTTLWRAVQTYQRFTQPEILDGSSTMLTWGKLRMLLPLPEAAFQLIWKRIQSGELRTDEQVRDAIIALKHDLGLDRPALGEPRYQLELHMDFDTDRPFRVSWGKANPIDRIHLLTELLPLTGLERSDRGQALKAIQYTRQRLDAYERKLGKGATR